MKRWYLSLIFIPIIVNFITNTISYKDLIENPLMCFLVISLLVNIIFTGEYFILKSRYSKLNTIDNTDKKNILSLLSFLNLEDNEGIIRSASHTEKIKYEYLDDLRKFFKESHKSKYLISNRFVKKDLKNLIDSLDNYLEVLARDTVSYYEDDGNYFAIPYENKHINYDLYNKRIQATNQALDMFEKNLDVLMNNLKNKNYI